MNRRNLCRAAGAATVVPLLALNDRLDAATGPPKLERLEESNPLALALSYVRDASTSPKRTTVEQQTQFCENCLHYSNASEVPSPHEYALICRAAVATLMGRPIDIITAAEVENDMIRTQYRRPDDATVWRNLCRFDGNRVVWATIRSDGTAGRWRNHPLDPVVTFDVQTTALEIKVTDGGELTTEKRFALGSSPRQTSKKAGSGTCAVIRDQLVDARGWCLAWVAKPPG